MTNRNTLRTTFSLVLLLIWSTSVTESFVLPSDVPSPRRKPTTRSSSPVNVAHNYRMMNVDGDVELASSSSSPSRRQFWKTVIASGVSLGTIQHSSAPANAFERTDVKFTYTINVPESMKEGSKPVKTHQDEVNFGSSGIRGYQYGITVDPVRINSLKEFGTPEEVAARVVTAEVNRDGVFEVTLLKDPIASDDGGYLLEYLSVGKRGNKHCINKIFIQSNELFVLTAQCKQENYEELKNELNETVKSFQV